MKFEDSVSVGSTKKTEQGYLVASARVARTGVQEYLASELGDIAISEGFNPSDRVRVIRTDSEVFSADSLKTITRMPVTVGHPVDHVTADNWSKYAVGEVGDAYAKDGEWIIVNPMIKDASAIIAASSTHKQISMGYTADIVKYNDSSIADFEQKNIRFNHLAIVQKARAGDRARIGDAWGAVPMLDYEQGNRPITTQEVSDMDLKTVVLGDAAVQVAVSDLSAIEAYKTSMAKRLEDAATDKKKMEEEKDEEIGKLKAELKNANDAAAIDVDSLVQARSLLVADVKAIDSSIEVSGKTDADLRKAAVASKLGDEIVKDASEAEISGMFKALILAKPGNPVADSIRGAKPVKDAGQKMDDAYSKSISDMNSWRNAQ